MRAGWPHVIAIDEVGRGALAGPVCVGAVLVTPGTPPAPLGVADSKVLTAPAREALVPGILAWAPAAVGSADAAEIDDVGLTAALGLAAGRAVAALGVPADHVLLDGTHDWTGADRVRTQVRADGRCAAVAAASIVAKVHRDAVVGALMRADGDPYDWATNKGYATARHRAALRELGPSHWHRRSWRLGV